MKVSIPDSPKLDTVEAEIVTLQHPYKTPAEARKLKNLYTQRGRIVRKYFIKKYGSG